MYEADLLAHPANGWALRGKVAALQALAHTEEARHVEQTQLRVAWMHADVQLNSSCPQFSSL